MDKAAVALVDGKQAARDQVKELLNDAIKRAEDYKCTDVLVMLVDDELASHCLFTTELSLRERVGLLAMAQYDMQSMARTEYE